LNYLYKEENLVSKINHENKNLLYILSIFAILFASCEKNETASLDISTLKYNEQKYTLAAGGIVDSQMKTLFGTTSTHKNYDFYTTDGEFVFNKAGEFLNVKGSVVAFAELNSPNGVDFQTGVFQYLDSSDDYKLSNQELKNKYEGKFFFTYGYIISETRNNALLNFSNKIDVESGSIKVSGTKPNYTIEYELILENGKTASGKYSKGFLKL
jgi:hypothetical protein